MLSGIGYNDICFLTYANGGGVMELLSHGIDARTTCLIRKSLADEFCFILTEGIWRLNEYARSIPADFTGSTENLKPFLSEIEAPDQQRSPEMGLPF